MGGIDKNILAESAFIAKGIKTKDARNPHETDIISIELTHLGISQYEAQKASNEAE